MVPEAGNVPNSVQKGVQNGTRLVSEGCPKGCRKPQMVSRMMSRTLSKNAIRMLSGKDSERHPEEAQHGVHKLSKRCPPQCTERCLKRWPKGELGTGLERCPKGGFGTAFRTVSDRCSNSVQKVSRRVSRLVFDKAVQKAVHTISKMGVEQWHGSATLSKTVSNRCPKGIIRVPKWCPRWCPKVSKTMPNKCPKRCPNTVSENSVRTWHLDVHEHDVRRVLLHQLQHLEPVTRRPNVVKAQRLEHLMEHFLVYQVVFDDEDLQRDVAPGGGGVGGQSGGGGEGRGGALVGERLQERGVEGVDAHRLGDADDALLERLTLG